MILRSLVAIGAITFVVLSEEGATPPKPPREPLTVAVGVMRKACAADPTACVGALSPLARERAELRRAALTALIGGEVEAETTAPPVRDHRSIAERRM